MSDAAIVTTGLSKRYSHADQYALHDLTLCVGRGEIYGYLGANGAGKSTTIRLLMNFLQPTSGSATIAGFDIVTESVSARKRVGYLAGDVALPIKMTGKELLDYLAGLQGGVDPDFRHTIEKRFEADTSKPIGALSKGNRQKIGILQALMHRPDILILDEPTSGLDPLMQEVFYDCLREAKARGAAVLMSSHNLAEAQRVCDRVGIIKYGKLIREQAITELADAGVPVFTVTFRDHKSVSAVKKDKALKLVSQTDSNVVKLQPAGTIAAALAALAKHDIIALDTERADLEDEFLEFYGDGQ